MWGGCDPATGAGRVSRGATMSHPGGISSGPGRPPQDPHRTTPGGQRGAVAVEAAIVLPLLITVLLGIVDVSLLMRADVGLTAAVRNGARVASAEPRVPSFAVDAADAVLRAGTGVPVSDIRGIWVYRANSAGYPGPEGTQTFPPVCPPACIRFEVRDGSPIPVDGTWPADSIRACPGDSDAVGVRVLAATAPVTGGLLSPSQLSRRAVMRFEPVASDGVPCAP